VFQNAEAVEGDPTVEIAIRLAPDGTVTLPLKVTKSSGNAAWDTAVLRGIEKTETFPRDSDGKFPAPFTLAWRLKE
jgi:colicin import membrane protein